MPPDRTPDDGPNQGGIEPTYLTPLKQSNLRESAREAIRSSIVMGQIAAGTIYPVGYFESQLGVSATPIREALFDLANEGLVEVVKNRGFRVTNVTDKDLLEIFELRDLLETRAMESLAGTVSDAQISNLRQVAAESKSFALAGDVPGFLSVDRRFHQNLLALVDNRRLATMVNRLRDAARVYGLPQVSETGQLVISAEEHMEMIEAIAEGDAKETKEWIKHHLAHTRGVWFRRRTESDLEDKKARSRKEQRSTST
ncbi:MAG TPA: GntR family transcriptional regulator [Candidatus Micrarchaeaceae archaeon]|nr:GntR family transcriptional regulator [Candidatus Micrarchaeaceae archaeon]